MELDNIEGLFSGFSSSTRANIRKGIRNNCIVTKSNQKSSIDAFYSLHQVTGQRDNFIIRSKEYFYKMYDLYKDKIIIWKVMKDNQLIGSTVSL